ncbi:MAG: PDZ domain-containing protein [Deltaproteobacteria bacterium]|nr:PDZ domain-containing protein [Deltaproteobacteria bacterium]
MAARRLASAPLAALCCAWLAGPALAEGPMPEGYPGRGRIGIEVQPMTAELREFFEAPATQGVLIVRVEPGRPAELAKIRVGDVVIAAAGEPLVRPRDLVAIVARAPAGAPLELMIVRKKRTRTLSVVPDGEPATAAALEAWHERAEEPPAEAGALHEPEGQGDPHGADPIAPGAAAAPAPVPGSLPAGAAPAPGPSAPPP